MSDYVQELRFRGGQGSTEDLIEEAAFRSNHHAGDQAPGGFWTPDRKQTARERQLLRWNGKVP
jgi:hypothetical protein